MKKIREEETKKIVGGGSVTNWGLITFAAGFISFVLGVLDGVISPKKCNT